MNKPRTLQSGKQRHAATSVEMALVLSLFLLFLFAFFELGHALMIDSVTENAAYEGARRGIVPGASLESARQAAAEIALASSLRSVDVQVQSRQLAPYVQGITVTVNASLSENSIFLGMFLGNATISRSVTMIHESGLRYLYMPGPRPVPEPTPRPRGRGHLR